MALEPPERHAERDEPQLCPVVQVAFEPLPFLVAGVDHACAARFDLVEPASAARKRSRATSTGRAAARTTSASRPGRASSRVECTIRPSGADPRPTAVTARSPLGTGTSCAAPARSAWVPCWGSQTSSREFRVAQRVRAAPPRCPRARRRRRAGATRTPRRAPRRECGRGRERRSTIRCRRLRRGSNTSAAATPATAAPTTEPPPRGTAITNATVTTPRDEEQPTGRARRSSG